MRDGMEGKVVGNINYHEYVQDTTNHVTAVSTNGYYVSVVNKMGQIILFTI